jgi:hypothetical protein
MAAVCQVPAELLAMLVRTRGITVPPSAIDKKEEQHHTVENGV